MFKRYSYWIEAEYDTPQFKHELEQISQDKSHKETILKEDIATSIWRASYRSRALLIKRYNTRGIWHAFRRSFRKSRADNCRNMGSLFAREGIYTAANIAVIQEWLGPIKLRSWFISEYIEGTLLVHYFANQTDGSHPCRELDQLKTNTIKLFRSLRARKLSHGDLKASNIILSGDRLYLIDLDAARAHKNKSSFSRAHQNDQARFMKNWASNAYAHQLFEPLVNSHHPL
jgi:serine/threonine protein kinase